MVSVKDGYVHWEKLFNVLLIRYWMRNNNYLLSLAFGQIYIGEVAEPQNEDGKG